MSQLKMLFSKMFVLFLFAVMVAVMESRQAFRYILTYLILHIFCTKVGEQVTRQCWPWCDPGTVCSYHQVAGAKGDGGEGLHSLLHRVGHILTFLSRYLYIQESQSTWLADNTCQRWKWRFQCEKYAKQMFHNTDRPDNKVRCRF